MSTETEETICGMPRSFVGSMAKHASMSLERFRAGMGRRQPQPKPPLSKDERALVRVTLEEFGVREPRRPNPSDDADLSDM